MYPNLKKITRRCEELESLRHRDSRPVGAVQVERVSIKGEAAPAVFELKEGDRWGERDAIYLLSFELAIPPEWRGQNLALRLDFSASASHWTINTVEGLLFINGRPLHALDRYHREIILPPEYAAQERLNISIRMWTGINEDSHVIQTLCLRRLDQAADRLYFLMKLLLDMLTVLPEHSPTSIALLTALDEAVNRLDFRDARSDSFYASCQEALAGLTARWQALARENLDGQEWQPRVTATGHAHIDVAWLWQLRHTRIKAANTFSTAIYHMERYPHFVFTQSQPQLYQFVKEDQPDLYEMIRRKVTAGQWEPEGAMWVEADTNITGAESLARQFLFGQRFFRQEFGQTTRVLWLPDVFGYSPALPQLIKQAGAEYFITTKLSWNDTNRIPADTFWWQGLDGSRVLTYFVTSQGEDNQNFNTTYNAEMRPSVMARAWQIYQQKELNRELLASYGWGDGGGGPTREMVEAAGWLATPVSPEVPAVRTGKVAAFMDRLAARVADQPGLPEWVGELYLEYHRGTYTSQARNKRANRLAERDLHNAEFLASAAAWQGAAYPQAELNQAWQTVLTNQFHDILPGSSIGPVYTDAAQSYAAVAATTTGLIEQAGQQLMAGINAPEGSLAVFNSTGWERADLVEVPAGVAKSSGLPHQELGEDKALCRVEQVPGYGWRAFAPGTAPKPAVTGELAAGPDFLENRFYRLELNERGQLTRLYDKSAGREVIRPGERASVFQMFEDKPINFDAWDIDAFYELKSWELDNLVSGAVVEEGPLRAGLRLEWNYRGRTRIEQFIYLYDHTPRIDFVTDVDWQERQTLLKAAFPVDLHSPRATAEIQWGNLERPTHRNTSWDRARFETCAHKWFDLSEGDYGVAILNDCKYGYDVHGRVMRLTLLKGAIDPDPEADRGRHIFTYSLLPHAGNWFEGQVHREAYALNYPLLPFVKSGLAPAKDGLPAGFALLQARPANLIIETVKQAEDSEALVVRLYECANRRGPYELDLGFPVARAEETNLLEENGRPLEISPNGRTVQGYITPYQVKTILLYPA